MTDDEITAKCFREVFQHDWDKTLHRCRRCGQSAEHVITTGGNPCQPQTEITDIQPGDGYGKQNG